jgi:hypothetical protein
MVEVVRPQPVAEHPQIDSPDQGRESIPPFKEVDGPIDNIQEPLQQAMMEFKTIVLTRHLRSKGNRLKIDLGCNQ